MVSEVQKFPTLMMQELDTYDSALCECFSVNRQPSKVLDFQFSYGAVIMSVASQLAAA